MQTKTRLAIAAVALTAIAGAAVQASIPQDMVGEWRWGTINPTTFHDRSSGAYLGHGGGMSLYFIFKADGSYTKYFYVEQSPTAGWTTKAWSESYGKVVVEGDTFRLKPTRGHYRGEDNRVKKYNIDRDMTAADLQNEANGRYKWSMGKDGGRTVMYINPGSTGQGSMFQKVK